MEYTYNICSCQCKCTLYSSDLLHTNTKSTFEHIVSYSVYTNYYCIIMYYIYTYFTRSHLIGNVFMLTVHEPQPHGFFHALLDIWYMNSLGEDVLRRLAAGITANQNLRPQGPHIFSQGFLCQSSMAHVPLLIMCAMIIKEKTAHLPHFLQDPSKNLDLA